MVFIQVRCNLHQQVSLLKLKFDACPGQNQSSWFVITGKDFEVDAHNVGGIDGNGQVRILLSHRCPYKNNVVGL